MGERLPNTATTQLTAEVMNRAVDRLVQRGEEEGAPNSPQHIVDDMETVGIANDIHDKVSQEVGILTSKYGISEEEAVYLIENQMARDIVYKIAGRPENDMIDKLSVGEMGATPVIDNAGKDEESPESH
jgi:hypothetical protein